MISSHSQLEQNLNRGLLIYDNNFIAMIASNWIAMVIFAIVAVLILWQIAAPLLRRRDESASS